MKRAEFDLIWFLTWMSEEDREQINVYATAALAAYEVSYQLLSL